MKRQAQNHNQAQSQANGASGFWNMAPSWLYLLSGLFLLAATLLVPAWIQLDEMRYQRQLMQAQVEIYEQQVQVYKQMVQALDRNDPGLVKRLAQQQFNLTAPGEKAIPLEIASNDPVGQARFDEQGNLLPSSLDPYCIDPMGRAPKVTGLDAILSRALPEAPEPPSSSALRQTHLVRLASGPHRMGLMLVGGAFLFVGLIRQTPAEQMSVTDRIHRAASRAD